MTEYWERYLFSKISEHYKLTLSNHSKQILDNWETEKYCFWQIIPKEMINLLKNPAVIENSMIA